MYVSVSVYVVFISLNALEKDTFLRQEIAVEHQKKTDFPLMSFDTHDVRSMQIKSIWSLEILCN